MFLFEICGPAGTCDANAAKAAQASGWEKVVSQGSDGTR